MFRIWLCAALPATFAVASAALADPRAEAGRSLFHQQCVICHVAQAGDHGGGQGPSLVGVYGRHAAAVSGFSYTSALRAANLSWDAATLDQFLRSPARLVPGTAMPVAVPDPTIRADLIAYLQTISATESAPQPEVPAVKVPPASRRSADWRNDAPGRVHRINVEALPAPFATPSASNESQLVARPAMATLAAPHGFKVDMFAAGLTGPRKMLVASNGDVFVSEMSGGRVSVLHPTADGTAVASKDVYSAGLDRPFGLAFYPNARAPKWLYVAEVNRVTRYAYSVGDTKPRMKAEVVVADLPTGGGHTTRDVAFSSDGTRMFVSVGSASNVAESMEKNSPDEIRAWELTHSLGAAWGTEANRATVLVYDVEHRLTSGRIFATGLRNCVSLTVQPANGELWCTTNERDGLGDDLVPDYSTRVRNGGYYGWPWYYFGAHEDPRLAGDRPDLRGKALVPEVPYQAHSASLGLTFYTETHGQSAFPPQYVGDAFAAFHGSWNRSLRTGYKLVRVRMKDGAPTGAYEDFVTGFIIDDTHVWGRPVATVELADGSLLMSEDANNTIYRISFSR